MNFGYVFAQPYFAWLCRGLAMTLTMAAASGTLALLLGFLVLRCRTATNRSARIAGAGFVLVFRNLPLVPFLLFLTAALPGFWHQIMRRPLRPGFELPMVLLGLALNTAAYLAEILRPGVEAVAPEQMDAARTLGLPVRV